MSEWAKNNPEKMKICRHRWYINNLEKAKEYRYKLFENNPEYNKQYREKNKERMSEYSKQYYINNKENILKKTKEYRQKNEDKIKEYAKKYRKEHKTEINEYTLERYKTNPKFNINSKMSRRIYKALKGIKGGQHWEEMIDYTLFDLVKRLKSTMPEGYTWQDYMKGRLHIDHIVPVSAFNFTKPEHADFKRCWALSNLRLLPARENLEKRAKLFKPFQPSLAI